MRVLFYLPAVTANWFHDTVVHLIRSAARAHDVHVIAPIPWKGTGLRQAELDACADLVNVHWHIINGDDHPSYRAHPLSPDDLVAFVRQIDPAYTICRSADVATPQRFPGKVAFLMEGEFAPTLFGPVPKGGRVMIDGPRIFDFGFLPELDADQRDWLDRQAAPSWARYHAQHSESDREQALAAMQLSTDKKIVALPLQYQGADNFFGQVHGNPVPADEFVGKVSDALGDDYLLAVSVHPIDRRQGSANDIVARINERGAGRVCVLPAVPETYQGEATEILIRYCDALVLAESKAIAIGAFHGKPMLRVSRYDAAPWTNAYTDVAAFRDALDAGTARPADPAEARIWFAYHFANNAFTGALTDFADVIDRIDQPHNPDRWERSLY